MTLVPFQPTSTAQHDRAQGLHRPGEPLSGASMIWETLVREGVEVVFGYPGGMILPAYDALPRYPIHHVLVRHEQGAAHMADGYARASGRVGVAIATSGPGATNLVTGIANAMMDSVPMVCITGQVLTGLLGSDAFQETDITGITLPITKHCEQVTRADQVVPALRRAFALARSGRPGPVLVDITKDAQLAKAPFEWPEPPSAHASTPPAAEQDEILCALALLASSERPIILAGHGVLMAHASDKLVSFAEATQVPVASTLLGLSAMPGGHPQRLGMMGMHGEAWVNRAIQRADLVLALGMRFDDRATGNIAAFAPHARIIHVERDRTEMGKNVRVDLPIAADAGDVLGQLLDRVALTGPAHPRRAWHEEIDAFRREAATRDILHAQEGAGLSGPQVIRDLCMVTRGRATVIADVGQHQMWVAQYYHAVGARRFFTSGGHGTMGFALPAAIGARFALPDEEIWVVAGDGGFQMTASELSTLVQENLKINIAILNNGHLGMVRQQQDFFCDKRYVASAISGPDFVMLAQAHGLEAVRVDRRADLASALARARAARGSVVLDLRIEPLELVYPTVPGGAPLDQMIRRPVRSAVRHEVGSTPSAAE